MSREKKIRNHRVLNHPIAAMLLLMLWGGVFYSAFSQIFTIALGEDFGNWGGALGAVLALVLHRAWFSPEFKGSVGAPRFRAEDVKLAFCGFAALVIVFDLIGFIGHEIAFTMGYLGLALMAGIGEEMFVRVLPISVMMRDWMDEKHIPFVAYSTAVIFGLAHFINLGGGASMGDTLVQVVSAAGIGIMFAAFYLRTGNILLCMVLHTVHDMLCFMPVGATDSSGIIQGLSGLDVAAAIIGGIAGAVLGVYLIRRQVRSDIVEVWKERWNRK